jgi:hypothetical protein
MAKNFEKLIREREESWGVVRDTTFLGGGCIRNIIWQFGRFPGSAASPSGKGFDQFWI